MEEQSSSCAEPIGGVGELVEVPMEAEVEVSGNELVWIFSPPGASAN